MANNYDKDKKNRVTKEMALALTPLAAAYFFITFFNAGRADYFGIPYSLINISFIDIILSNRLALIAAVIAFLWTGLYYNLLPNVNSPIFRGIITAILIFSLWIGFNAGRFDAKSQINYLVVHNQQNLSLPDENLAVVRLDNKSIIAVPFNKVTRQFSPSFVMLERDSAMTLKLTHENIGPLSPQK